MNYFKSLKLDAEPFSNSPDPNLFFPSNQHAQGLQWLEIGVRLKRGLHVIIGDIGTGKTTICRKLLQGLVLDDSVCAMLILDPGFTSAKSFLQELHCLFTDTEPDPDKDERALKETLKSVLYKRAVDNNELLVLVIDEGQKLSFEMLEVLRELLNYETNEEKLLQIIIFGQKELTTILDQMPNLKDRINKQIFISPLTKKETAEFIQFRLRRSATGPDYPQFSKRALKLIFKKTKGYPRQIVTLCHQVILHLATINTNKATLRTVKDTLQGNNLSTGSWSLGFFAKLATATTIIAFSIYLLFASNTAIFDQLQTYLHPNSKILSTLHILNPEKYLSESKPPVSSNISQAQGSTTTNAAPKQVNSPQVSDIENSTSTPPALLGVIKLRRGSSLSKLMDDVYGTYSKQLLHKVLSINPQIHSPNTIAAETPIILPAATLRSIPTTPPKYWLEIERKKQLPKAIALLTDLNKFHKTFRLICAWNARQGLHFPIILRTVFSTRKEAMEVLQITPKKLQLHLKVVQYPQPETLYCGSF